MKFTVIGAMIMAIAIAGALALSPTKDAQASVDNQRINCELAFAFSSGVYATIADVPGCEQFGEEGGAVGPAAYVGNPVVKGERPSPQECHEAHWVFYGRVLPGRETADEDTHLVIDGRRVREYSPAERLRNLRRLPSISAAYAYFGVFRDTLNACAAD